MAKSIVIGLLILVMIICVCLIWQTFKSHPNKKSPIIFRQFIVVIGCHALAVLLGLTLFKNNELLSNSSPFFFYYGLYFYLFVKSLTSLPVVEHNAVSYNKHFLLPSFFASGYFFLAIVSNRLSDQFIYVFFSILFIFEGVLTVYYSVKIFYLLVNKSTIKDTLRLHLMAINALLLFIGVILISFLGIDFSLFLLYRLLLTILVVVLILYLVVVYKYLVSVFDESDCVNHQKKTEFVFVDHSLVINYKEGGTEKEVNVLIEDTEVEKYTKSKLTDSLLSDYTHRINSTLIDRKLYLDQDFSLDELSSITKISKHHLGQYFSGVHHSNFNKFINQLRIEYIVSYIQTNKEVKLSVNDLLALSSFKSRASFFRNFKDFTGSAPSDYLKTYYESIGED